MSMTWRTVPTRDGGVVVELLQKNGDWVTVNNPNQWPWDADGRELQPPRDGVVFGRALMHD